MAGKKEYTKKERIKKEKTRLKGIFKNLDENKKKLVTPLIEKAAFMSVELDILQDSIQENGWTAEYQNGANQWGEKRSAEADTYIALSKAVCSHSNMVATRAINFVVSINALGLNCNVCSRFLSALPSTSGFSLLQCVAKLLIAVRVKSISYTPPS